MSIDKAIKYGKEHRREYRGAKAFDKSCRNHGGGNKYQCPWCLKNRMHKYMIRNDAMNYKFFEYNKESKYLDSYN